MHSVVTRNARAIIWSIIEIKKENYWRLNGRY